MQYSSIRRFFRKFFAIFLSILIIIASIAIVMAAKYGENQIEKSFNTSVDCKYVENKGIEDLKIEILSGVKKNNRVVAHCFCLQTLISKQINGVQNVVVEINGEKNYACQEWLDLWLKSQTLKIGIIVLVPIINIILSLALEFFTAYEKNKSLSNIIISIMTKSYILQLFNTGIVIVLVNANVKVVQDWYPDFPFFTGKYSDFDPGWYSDVGTTIFFYMILNMVTPHVAPIIGYILTSIKRCFDRCCAANKISSKLTKNEYFELYVGPDFSMGSRYAQILSTIFVVIIFSSGIPFLYVCCFLFFVITYWVDKFMLLRFYRTPPHTDLFVSKLFNQIVLFGIIVHLCVGIWIYGNKELFINVNSTFLDFISNFLRENLNFGTSDGISVGIKEKLIMPHNLLMTIVLALLTLYFIWRLILRKIFKYLCCIKFFNCQCKRKKLSKNIELLESMPLSSVYFNHQLHISQYIKYLLSREDEKESLLEKKYFKQRLQRNREELAKRLNINIKNEIEAENLEERVEDDILSKEIIEDHDKEIIGDRSYNIADHYQFRHLIYFEYFAAFIKKKNENPKTEFQTEVKDNGFGKPFDDKMVEKANGV